MNAFSVHRSFFERSTIFDLTITTVPRPLDIGREFERIDPNTVCVSDDEFDETNDKIKLKVAIGSPIETANEKQVQYLVVCEVL